MSYNDLKNHEGKNYSGMPIGRSHEWIYPEGRWEETKIAPDQWKIKFTSAKRRTKPAPEGSGAGTGTQFHWLIIADQIVEKKTKDEYQTTMEGLKFKIGHKRPYWKGMSYTYKGQKTKNQKTIEALKTIINKLEKESENQAPGSG